MRVPVILLALVGCRGDTGAVAALEERVDHLQRRLEAVEASRTPPVQAAAPAEPEISPEPGPRPSTHPVVRIGIDRWGITVDGVPIATDMLDASLQAAAGRPGLTGVLVDAAPDVEHASVLALLDRIKGSGLARLAIATRGGRTVPEPAFDDDADDVTAR